MYGTARLRRMKRMNLNTRISRCSAGATVALGVFALVSVSSAQDATREKSNYETTEQYRKRLEQEDKFAQKPTPRTSDGHVDFNGFWNNFEKPEDVTSAAGALRTPDGNVLW